MMRREDKAAGMTPMITSAKGTESWEGGWKNIKASNAMRYMFQSDFTTLVNNKADNVMLFVQYVVVRRAWRRPFSSCGCARFHLVNY